MALWSVIKYSYLFYTIIFSHSKICPRTFHSDILSTNSIVFDSTAAFIIVALQPASHSFNSYRLSNVYMRPYTRSSLVQKMIRRQIGRKPLTEPMLVYYTHRFNEVERGVILVSPCPSVRLSVCPSVDSIVSALYLQQYSYDPFHIWTSYQAVFGRLKPPTTGRFVDWWISLSKLW